MTTEPRLPTCGLCGWPAETNGFCFAHSWAAPQPPPPPRTPSGKRRRTPPPPPPKPPRRRSLTQDELVLWWQRRHTPEELSSLAWEFNSLRPGP